ncbi:MAG: SUMF1/EgtB/PvdO family nonheme iron enzyme [Alphaproteobacteria bacterium]|nr:SUMF1/EgtB/PvdO family nonheme iron enzyme [Alphaproteobacteria bacterium]
MRCSLVLFLLSACTGSGLSHEGVGAYDGWTPPAFRADYEALSAEQGAELLFDLDVPAGTTVLYVATRGGEGNADLAVRQADTMLCTSDGEANDEVCAVWDPPAGPVQIALFATEAFSGVDLDHELAGVPGPEPETSDTADGPCPADMVSIEDWCIDRYEAHLAGQSPFEVPSSGVAQNAAGAIPQGYISGIVAEAACEAAGKRLCTATEWRRACQGPSGTLYPYGNTYDPEACNVGRTPHPVVELFGSNADWSGTQMNDPGLNQLPDSLAPSGDNPGCVTAEGVYDMHGNLHEWVADSAGTFQGGFYVDASINGEGCTYRTTRHTYGYHDYSTGFRCCADAP